MQEEIKMDTNELSHHGILGQRWGVRRTPAQLGHKPSTKRKISFTGFRKGKSNTKSDNKEDKNKKSNKPKKKSISEMTDDELRNKINRLELERQYYDKERQVAAFNPKKVSVGKRFAQHVGSQVLKPALTNVGKQYLEKMLKDKMGLNEKKAEDPLASLKKEAEMYENRRKIEEGKKYFAEQEKKITQERQKAESEASAAKQAIKEEKRAAKEQAAVEALIRKVEKEQIRSIKQTEKERQKAVKEASKSNSFDWDVTLHTPVESVRGKDYEDMLSKNEEEFLKRFKK